MTGQAAQDRAGALVIGASSGIGAALARQLVARGYRVALVARRHADLEALAASLNAGAAGGPVAFAYPHDVTAYHEAPMLFSRIAGDLAPLRLIIYAAGVMTRAPIGANFAGEHAMLETNTVGAMRWLSLGADYLAQHGGGALVGVSSVAGDRGRPGNGAYMASKAALSAYLDSLRFKLRGTGVRVVTIKPGFVATPMTAGLTMPRRLTVSPDVVARRIAGAAGGNGVVYVPGIWRPIMWLVRHLPAAVVARMPG
ncbi:MAG TPA: SDR family NAD(P)-dependent oxidoreductase [Ktedonobacterales bacterium]|nr:SDR family NAD(P)-dependent oxidoreductase [Ktedonobacterales bacterium]